MTPIADPFSARQCVGGDGVCTLAELTQNCPTRIVGLDGDDVIARRLLDLGFTPGETAELVRRAPLQDPLMFCVGGCEIVLRKSEARRVLVEAP